MIIDASDERWVDIDCELLADRLLMAVKYTCDRFGVGLADAMQLVTERRAFLYQTHPEEMPARDTTMTLESQRTRSLAKADRLPGIPLAIEAFWDGDTQGWFVILSAVVRINRGEHTIVENFGLGELRHEGGDMRLFNGEVPPWPEAALAAEVGEQLATRFGVPFYFPSPTKPSDDCPRWLDRVADSQ